MVQASKIRVGVVRGGTSGEYPVSLLTGGAVLKNLSQAKYKTHDILITRDGKWHVDGVEKSPEQIIRHLDVIFNALHGDYGEDGKIQQFFDLHGVKYTGSGALASAIAMNKILTKQHATKEKIKTAVHTMVRRGEDIAKRAAELFRTFPHPAVVKPATAGSSLGVSIVSTHTELEQAIHEALKHSDTVIIEEYITGKEATCGVIDAFRGERHYALPPIEIRKPEASPFFDYEAKYAGGTEEICPGNFTPAERDEIQRIAREVHRSLNLKHYSRSDFIVSPRRGVYFLEVNTLPGLTAESLLPKSLEAVGAEFPDFLDHLVSLAIERK